LHFRYRTELQRKNLIPGRKFQLDSRARHRQRLRPSKCLAAPGNTFNSKGKIAFNPEGPAKAPFPLPSAIGFSQTRPLNVT
jgi:hypothetical protein